MKRILILGIFILFISFLVACGDSKEEATSESELTRPLIDPTTDSIKILVDYDEATAYKHVLNQYAHYLNLPYEIEFIGYDTSIYTDIFLEDPSVGADIFISSYNDIDRLIDSIATVSSEELNNAIECELPTRYVELISRDSLFYAVPVSQETQVLYYNKKFFSGRENYLKSWEGILEVAKDRNRLATTYEASYNYNFSHWLLAKPSNNVAINYFGYEGTFRRYNDGDYLTWGLDQILIQEYAMNFTMNQNGRGGKIYGNDLLNERAITAIGGPSMRSTIEQAWGRENYGVTVLPTFTCEGYEFRSGSLVDINCLYKNAQSKHSQEVLDEIVRFLFSNEVQMNMSRYCDIVPTSIEVMHYDSSEFVVAQIEQIYGWSAYYLSGETLAYNNSDTLDLFINLHQSKSNTENIKEVLRNVGFIWSHNRKPKINSELAEWVSQFEK